MSGKLGKMLGNIGSFEAIDTELKEQQAREKQKRKIQRPSSAKIEFKEVEFNYETRGMPIIQNLSFQF